jgi:hypothetical protein
MNQHLFTVSIQCDSPSFTEDMLGEVSRILNEISTQVNLGKDRGAATDINGVVVGRYGFVDLSGHYEDRDG